MHNKTGGFRKVLRIKGVSIAQERLYSKRRTFETECLFFHTKKFDVI